MEESQGRGKMRGRKGREDLGIVSVRVVMKVMSVNDFIEGRDIEREENRSKDRALRDAAFD